MPFREQRLQALSRMMAYFTAKISLDNKRHHTDINHIFEREIKDILSLMYGNGIIWLETEKSNSAGIDYADFETRKAFQVSSTVDSGKISRTVDKVAKYYPEQFDTIYLIWLKSGIAKPSISKSHLKHYVIHIVDFADMLKKAESFDESKFTLFYAAFIKLFFMLGTPSGDPLTRDDIERSRNFISIIYGVSSTAIRHAIYGNQYYFTWDALEYNRYKDAIHVVNSWFKSLQSRNGGKKYPLFDRKWCSQDPCYCLNESVRLLQERIIEDIHEFGELLDAADCQHDGYYYKFIISDKASLLRCQDLHGHSRDMIKRLEAYIENPDDFRRMLYPPDY